MSPWSGRAWSFFGSCLLPPSGTISTNALDIRSTASKKRVAPRGMSWERPPSCSLWRPRRSSRYGSEPRGWWSPIPPSSSRPSSSGGRSNRTRTLLLLLPVLSPSPTLRRSVPKGLCGWRARTCGPNRTCSYTSTRGCSSAIRSRGSCVPGSADRGMGRAELDAVLKDGRGGVFFLHGSDEYGKERFAGALRDAYLDPSTGDFNFDLLRGSEVRGEELATVLGTPPMMAQWRVVLLRETQALSSSPKARDLLLETTKSPPEGLVLILLCTVPQRSSARFYSDLRRGARSVEFRNPDPNDLPGWLMGWSRESFGRELDEDAARALAQAVGADLAILASELEKLSTLVGEGGRITREAVEAVGTRIPRQDRWEWFDLVGAKRFSDATRGLQVLLDHGESGVGLVTGLGTHLLRLGLVRTGGPPALSSALPEKQRFLVPRLADQARNWTVVELRRAIDGLLRADELLKSSRIPAAFLLEQWLLERMVMREAVA
ncbi:MAG: DNA polymerase III subunit delta [Gemmatimonadetes bacterium]|nr:DNA polymerase III subunit delta [Gemmatimonadota bacterium]